MLCPSCGWWDDWADAHSPRCEFCGAVHTAVQEDPPAAHEAVEAAGGISVTEPGRLPAEQQLIDQVAETRGEAWAEEHAALILAQADRIGELPDREGDE